MSVDRFWVVLSINFEKYGLAYAAIIEQGVAGSVRIDLSSSALTSG